MSVAAKRSPVIAAFDAARFEHGAVNDTLIAVATRSTINAAGFLADVSAAHKRMIAGVGARQFLESFGLEAPQALLRWRPLGVDGAVAYVHRNRFMLVAASQPEKTDQLFDEPAGRQGDVLVLQLEAADFALGGPAASIAVSELCPMNIDDAADDMWIATRLANCEVMMRRLRCGRVDYRLMCTPADAVFVFAALAGVIAEHGGSVAGYNDYLGLIQRGDAT